MALSSVLHTLWLGITKAIRIHRLGTSNRALHFLKVKLSCSPSWPADGLADTLLHKWQILYRAYFFKSDCSCSKSPSSPQVHLSWYLLYLIKVILMLYSLSRSYCFCPCLWGFMYIRGRSQDTATPLNINHCRVKSSLHYRGPDWISFSKCFSVSQSGGRI